MLSFVPPDGKFKLMDYRYSPATATAIAQSAIPFALRPVVTLDEHGGALDLVLENLTLSGRNLFPKVVFHFPAVRVVLIR